MQHTDPHTALWQYRADQNVHWSMRRNVYLTIVNSLYFTDAHTEVFQEVWYAKICFFGFSNSFRFPPSVPLHVSLKGSLGCSINIVAEGVKANMSGLLPSALVMNRHSWHCLLQNAKTFQCFLWCNQRYWITAASFHFPWVSPKYDLGFDSSALHKNKKKQNKK